MGPMGWASVGLVLGPNGKAQIHHSSEPRVPLGRLMGDFKTACLGWSVGWLHVASWSTYRPLGPLFFFLFFRGLFYTLKYINK